MSLKSEVERPCSPLRLFLDRSCSLVPNAGCQPTPRGELGIGRCMPARHATVLLRALLVLTNLEVTR
ncbi:hypothetical protein [Streptomyces noursei]|uniref:hypothetical protein n=1 Tax=Streptomyces noursei TaxID=1971 RepID=UPI00167A2521|nr:hypothetical protein [Streptomyces noursei]MCZ1021031.1 hypothetical protein [Streptomyces noursei]GGX52090.1 hypothetical protein GCM10010341_86900 [Streptomyces noursei]